MHPIIKTTLISAAAAAIFAGAGLQQWSRFFLLWAVLTPLSYTCYSVGRADGRRLLKWQVARASDQLASRESDPVKLSTQLETLEAIANEISD